MSDVFSGTPVQPRATEYNGWRLDFTPDSPTVVRARLRRGRGKKRNNVKDESGTVIIRNYVPLGRIEDVENNPAYRQWHTRCAEYRRKTGNLSSGTGVGVDSGTPKNGVAQPERGLHPPLDVEGQEEWARVRGGNMGYTH